MEFFIENYTNFLITHKIPYEAGFFLWYFIEFVMIILAILIAVLIFMQAERCLLARFARVNSDRACFSDCLQTVAEAIKLLFKENITPEKADKALFVIAPILFMVPIIMAWMILPLSSGFLPIKSSAGLLLFAAVMTIPTFGVLCAGYSSSNKYALIGAVRACLQIVSYEIPMLLSIMSVVILSGTMSLQKIVTLQYNHGILSWYCFPAILGFIIFFISALAEMNRTPFDFQDAESEIAAGYKTEYSGIKFAMFYLGEYTSAFIICVFGVTVFLGGYLPPIPFFLANFFEDSSLLYGLCLTLEQSFWLILKTALMLFIVILAKATLPRLRSDMYTALCWKYLIPLSVINLIIVCFIKLGGFYG